MGLQLSANTRAGRTVVSMGGALDERTVDTCRDYLQPFLKEGRPELVLYLHELESIDVAGLALLEEVWHRVREGDGDLRVAAPSEAVLQSLQYDRVGVSFTVHTNLAEAMRAQRTVDVAQRLVDEAAHADPGDSATAHGGLARLHTQRAEGAEKAEGATEA